MPDTSITDAFEYFYVYAPLTFRFAAFDNPDSLIDLLGDILKSGFRAIDQIDEQGRQIVYHAYLEEQPQNAEGERTVLALRTERHRSGESISIVRPAVVFEIDSLVGGSDVKTVLANPLFGSYYAWVLARLDAGLDIYWGECDWAEKWLWQFQDKLPEEHRAAYQPQLPGGSYYDINDWIDLLILLMDKDWCATAAISADRKGKPGAPPLREEEKELRMAYAMWAVELYEKRERIRSGEGNWKEVAREIRYHLGTSDSAMTKLRNARSDYIDLLKDPDRNHEILVRIEVRCNQLKAAHPTNSETKQ